jgi:hypothetical protein
MKVKEKKCRYCSEKFKPYFPLQVVCSAKCAGLLANKKIKEREEKEINDKVKKIEEKLKDRVFYMRVLQKIFNQYIRERDKYKGCISCRRIFTDKYDAGHFYPTSTHPGLRFDEDNVHGQCVQCNQHKHGNLILYAENLPVRIGVTEYEALIKRRTQVQKLTLPEIKEKITHYKSLIKSLKQNA